MIKEINIEGTAVQINSSARWFYIYREQFGRDILLDLMPVLDGIIGALADLTVDELAGLKDMSEAKDIVVNASAISDVFIKLAGLEVVTMFNVLWAMAKNADPSTPQPLEFINSFESMPLDVIAPELGKVLIDSCISSKNLESLRGVFRTKATTISA